MVNSGKMPRVLGILLIIAAAGYEIDSFGNILSPAYAANKTNFVIFVAVPAAVSEFLLTLWLLIKGGAGQPENPMKKMGGLPSGD